MGREIRKVPKGWEHPKNDKGRFRPAYDKFYIDALEEWIKEHRLWQDGKHPDQIETPESTGRYLYYSQWSGNPPKIEDYLHQKWTEEEAVCFQVYENVTEGTPVSPVFDSLQEVESWLIGSYNYTPEAAAALCESGWQVSFTIASPKDNCQQQAGNQNQHHILPKKSRGYRL